MEKQAKQFTGGVGAFHTCAACGITDVSHPGMVFRYCAECGGLGYCMDHIANHEHKKQSGKSD